MLIELAVRNLGVIEELVLVLGPGMTALTGETGAGKTLLVDAIELLVGGRAEAGVVRHGAPECIIEGRFVVDDTELVLGRVIPRDGRSRVRTETGGSPPSRSSPRKDARSSTSTVSTAISRCWRQPSNGAHSTASARST